MTHAATPSKETPGRSTARRPASRRVCALPALWTLLRELMGLTFAKDRAAAFAALQAKIAEAMIDRLLAMPDLAHILREDLVVTWRGGRISIRWTGEHAPAPPPRLSLRDRLTRARMALAARRFRVWFARLAVLLPLSIEQLTRRQRGQTLRQTLGQTLGQSPAILASIAAPQGLVPLAPRAPPLPP
jgi:hypothetical protein